MTQGNSDITNNTQTVIPTNVGTNGMQATNATGKTGKTQASKIYRRRTGIRHFPFRLAITLLRANLSDKPLELIKGIGTDYDAAWEYLDANYGDPYYVSDSVTQDITKFKPLQDGEDSRFCDLVHLVRRSYNTLKEVGVPGDIYNSHMLAIIERKMGPDDRKVW